MTFEDFFAKKKIDLKAISAKEKSLYLEMESHFLQMGEKSFDYSKKFLFNILRHRYPYTIPNVEPNAQLQKELKEV